MLNVITCPSCKAEFEATEVMAAQMSVAIRSELEAKFAEERRQLSEASRQLREQEDALKADQEEFQKQLELRLSAERDRLLAEARKQATDELKLAFADKEREASELKSKLDKAQALELEVRQKARELETRQEAMTLEIARQLDAERLKIRKETLATADEQHRLVLAEKDELMAQMRDQIQALQRKSSQASQQIQGEVQEMELMVRLSEAFSGDSFSDVPKGVAGGDLIQEVRTGTNRSCGTILWESKRTKNWSSAWLPKLRDDMRATGAVCAILVSEALPENVRVFEQIDGVWICSRSAAIPLAMAIRAGMVELAKNAQAMAGRQEQSQHVYDYLCGHEFRNHVSGIVEAMVDLQSQLDSEERTMNTQWKKRRKHLERAMSGLTGFYGDLQGLTRNAIPEVRHLSLGYDDTEAA